MALQRRPPTAIDPAPEFGSPLLCSVFNWIEAVIGANGCCR
jgi:hypothetical protein